MIKPFHVGIKAVIVKNDKVLLLRRYSGNTVWDFPGGRIDDGEEPNDTLFRELSEELPGITNISIHRLMGCKRMPKDVSAGFGHLLLFYLINADLPSPICLSSEHQSLIWIDPSEISDFIGVSLEFITDSLLVSASA